MAKFYLTVRNGALPLWLGGIIQILDRWGGGMDLIVGAGGFIGGRLARSLRAQNIPLRLVSRDAFGDPGTIVADLSDRLALQVACQGVETVFHCAGYAHAFSSLSDSDASKHWQVNYEGTRNLVEAAGMAGVKRFVFLSSVKAMAEPGEFRVDEGFEGAPTTAYGASKRSAEDAVIEIGRRYHMHVVNLRLCMVYGYGGRGNLERMGRLVQRGLFPPLPETGNHRSLIHVDDVTDVMQKVARDMRANGQTYIVAGPDAPSGRQLFDAIRSILGLSPCSWEVPQRALRWAGKLGDQLEMVLRKRMLLNSEVIDRLLGSSWYSTERIHRDLGWQGKVKLVDGLAEMFGK